MERAHERARHRCVCSQVVLFDMADLATCAICMADALNGAALGAAYGFEPPAVPGTVAASARKCQQNLSKAGSVLAKGWSQALDRCELGNAAGKNEPPLDCAADPGGKIAKAMQKAAGKVARCDDFGGIPGCATGGDAATVQACSEAAIDAVVDEYTEVAYP